MAAAAFCMANAQQTAVSGVVPGALSGPFASPMQACGRGWVLGPGQGDRIRQVLGGQFRLRPVAFGLVAGLPAPWRVCGCAGLRV